MGGPLSAPEVTRRGMAQVPQSLALHGEERQARIAPGRGALWSVVATLAFVQEWSPGRGAWQGQGTSTRWTQRRLTGRGAAGQLTQCLAASLPSGGVQQGRPPGKAPGRPGRDLQVVSTGAVGAPQGDSPAQPLEAHVGGGATSRGVGGAQGCDTSSRSERTGTRGARGPAASRRLPEGVRSRERRCGLPVGGPGAAPGAARPVLARGAQTPGGGGAAPGYGNSQ